MMTREQAIQFRKLLERQTDSMSDEEIINFSAFVEKWKVDTEYEVGKRLEYDGVVYKVVIAHTSQENWKPSETPSLYAEVLPGQDGTIGEWKQPDSTNPYMTGDKITYDGKTWESIIDNNIWQPGVYGWKECQDIK